MTVIMSRVTVSGLTISRNVEIRGRNVQPEKRMLLASVLLAVAQQDVKNVRWLNVRPSRMARISEVIAEESRLYVASDGFAEMCAVIDIDAEVLRELDPDKALELYTRVLEGKDLLEV